MHSAVDLVMCLGEFCGHVSTHIDGFDGVHGGYGVGQWNLEERMLLEFCLEIELCVSNTLFKRDEKRKVTFRLGENKRKVDFVLIEKEHQRFIQNVRAIPGECRHALMIANIDRKKIRKVVRKTCAERRKIRLL